MRNLTRTILLLSLILAIPAFARHRAVAAPDAPVLYTGTVVDAISGKPVIGATVKNGNTTTVTNSSGSFTIPVYIGSQTTLVVTRSGYSMTTSTFVYQPGLPATPIQMQPTATVTVITTSGKTVQLDFESVQFAYAQPLLTEVHSKTGRFCANGTELDVDTTQLSKILGPGAKSAGGACCNLTVDWFDIVLKDGTKQHVSLVFDCYTYFCYIGGKDHTTFQDSYFSFEEIKEVDFP